MSLNTKALSKQIANSLNNNGINKQISIFREKLNEFNEPNGKEKICIVYGYVYEEESKINISVNDGGSIKSKGSDKLLVTNNESSRKIKENDYFSYEDKKYKIIDLGNKMDIVFDMTLERI